MPKIIKKKTIINDKLRKEICLHAQKYPHLTQEQLAEFFNTKYESFNLKQSTISRLLKNKQHWLSVEINHNDNIVKHRSPKNQDLHHALYMWILQALESGIIITDAIIKQKGIIILYNT